MGAMMNEDRFGVITFVYDPASVAAATTAEQTVTVPGVRPGDYIEVTKPTLTAGVGIVNARVSAVDTVAIQWVNATAAPVDPPSETYTAFVFRPEKTTAGRFQP
ncbi:MAG: hypothetical protein IM650_11400 [Phenylobacterium sp.]|uniref:hypothetical protein n=1 Tax=Phenylobacterium sp. TaxID=1871053 RepID=UPI0025F931C2|nr:hypothetical protein [Phenylobacterium sp.]MCA6258686.1 hypothetical protein [Phenylobacterium sp.]MCA6263964.1 hypothetical protein [Phenylobacterium sp.]